MAARDPINSPLVTEGLSLVAQIEAKELARKDKALELKPFDDELKALNEKLEAIKAELIALGAGLYGDELGQTVRVQAGVPAKMSPDTFLLPDGAEEQARKLCGDHFLKLFSRRVIHEPKNGFDGIADALLTPAKARDLVAICIVPGKLSGGRALSVRWK